MIHIRLTRVGKRNQPLYRLIVIDKNKDPWAKYIEIIGTTNPRTKEKNLKVDRIKYWLSVGAQPSDTVRNMLITEKIMEGKKVSVTNISNKRKEKMAAKEKQS
jgi:small subunit ribosomal protein S16